MRVNPQYLRQVKPLVSLSASAAVTSTLSTNVEARLEWLSEILGQMNLKDTELREVTSQIMDVIGQRLQGAYMEISEANPSDPSLRKISALNRQVAEIKRLTA